jgi:hypothetical protein
MFNTRRLVYRIRDDVMRRTGRELKQNYFDDLLTEIEAERGDLHPLLIHWEFPRLCRGGSRSLTFQGVVSGHPSMKLRFVSRQSTRIMEFHQWTSSKA